MTTSIRRGPGRPRVKATPLHLNLSDGTKERVQRHFPNISVSMAVRHLLDRSLDQLDAQSAANHGKLEMAAASLVADLPPPPPETPNGE